MNPGDGEIDRREDAADPRRRRIPRPAARHGIRVEAPAPLLGNFLDLTDVGWIVRELQFLERGVAAFEVIDSVEQLRIVA